MKFLFFFIFFISFASQAQINQPYGLFFTQDNNLNENIDIFKVPTLKTDINVDLQGLFTTTTIKQYFINPTNSFTEAIYLFPLPDKSTVNHLRMKIGDRYINGIIKKKDKAEEIYQKAKKDGKKASIVSSSRVNIFKTKLANIAPGEEIIIEISYQEKIFLKNEKYNLRIPTVITHRYKPSKNDETYDDNFIEQLNYDSSIHSPINNNEYTINPYSINIELNTGFNIMNIKSTEPITIKEKSPSHYSIKLANKTMSSTKDFILSFQPIVSKDPYVQIYSEEIQGDLYLYGLINPQIDLHDLHLTDQSSITIIADISGSMGGSSLRQMKKILLNFITTLPEHYYLNVIAFDDNYYRLFSSPKKANSNNKYKILKFVKNLKAKGGTQMFAPVYESLFEKTSLYNDHQIILMTDGAISNETEVMALVSEHIGKKRFNVIGIGSAPNSYLMKGLAKAGKGTFLYVDDFTFNEKVNEFLYKINRPVIKNLHMVLSKKHEILPKKFPDVIANDPINFFIKIPNAKKDDFNKPIVLKGNHFSKPWKIEISIKDSQKGKNLKSLWAREKIDEMIFNNTIGSLDTPNFEKKTTDLALKNNLVTQFTSLIAVDEQIVRESHQPIKSHQIAQNIPAGWVAPEIKLMDLGQNSGKIQNLMNIQSLEKVDLNVMPTLSVHFVQTSTDKKYYYILSLFLFSLSFIFIRFRKSFY